MKTIFMTFLCVSCFCFSQSSKQERRLDENLQTLVSLTQDTAVKGLIYAQNLENATQKTWALAFLDVSGNPILLTIATGVGPHNLEAARKKAFTALSTKTATLILTRNAQSQPDSEHLNTVPELLLLGGGVPIVVQNKIVGSVGIAGAGGAEQDHIIAQQIANFFNNP
jgi:uncharacterized protein GlcG (DUF336 family)